MTLLSASFEFAGHIEKHNTKKIILTENQALNSSIGHKQLATEEDNIKNKCSRSLSQPTAICSSWASQARKICLPCCNDGR